MALGNYSLAKVLAVFNFIPITAFSPDDAVDIKPASEDDWTELVGMDGTVVRWEVGNPLYVVTFSLIWTSPSAKALEAIRVADRLTKGVGIGPLMISDTLGTVNLICGEAWISGGPSPKLANKPGNLVYTIKGVADVAFLA